jgi:TolB protein
MVLTIVLLSSFNAYGRVYLDIDSPAFQKFPIAVTDLKKLSGGPDTEKLSTWFSDTLSNSLNITGFFNIISKKAFLANPAADAINFADWSAIGAEYLIKGRFHYDQKDLIVDFNLYDIVKGETVIGKRYRGGYEDRKEMVLRFAGEVLYALTGEKGVFDTKIAFIVRKGRSGDVYTINFDGSALLRMTNHQAIMMSPRWSPDRWYLSFTSYRDGNPDLYIVDWGQNRINKVLHYKGLNLSGSWSPDSKRLLVTLSKDGNEEIYALEIATGKMQRLTDSYGIDISPTWSPDGKKIAFVSNRSGSPQIYVMDADGSNVNRISYEGNYNTAPSWSPKGGRIAYESRKNGRFHVFTMKEDGTDPMQLTFEDGDCESPSWSPDGRYLVFSSKVGKKQTISIMNANGSNRRVLHGGADGYVSPSWSGRAN